MVNTYLKKSMRSLFLLLLLWLPLEAAPFTKIAGDSAYLHKDYPEAVRIYSALLKVQPSADLYYNLGNAHFRLQDYPNAVLAYERCLHLDSSQEDARFNLAIVRARLIDHFPTPQEMFFVSWWKELRTSRSLESWTRWSYLFLLFTMFIGILFFFGRRVVVRKAGFFLSVLGLLGFLVTTLFAWQQRLAFLNNNRAVVMETEVPTYTSASCNSKKGPTLHEGTTIEIQERAAGGWLQILLPHSEQFWVNSSKIEEVVPQP